MKMYKHSPFRQYFHVCFPMVKVCSVLKEKWPRKQIVYGQFLISSSFSFNFFFHGFSGADLPPFHMWLGLWSVGLPAGCPRLHDLRVCHVNDKAHWFIFLYCKYRGKYFTAVGLPLFTCKFTLQKQQNQAGPDKQEILILILTKSGGGNVGRLFSELSMSLP
jgi:hypothetical protein